MATTSLKSEIARCTLCTERFAVTKTAHRPHPVVWFDRPPRILVAGQAPGLRVHQSGIPFDDRSGDRLRDWMGIDRLQFYDTDKVAILPMAFCFPGYDASGSDLPPPKVCAATWHSRAMDELGDIELTLLIGGYAQNWHLDQKPRRTVTETVRSWRETAPRTFPLPHPSWRNTAWIRKNSWFETELLPELKTAVQKALQ